MGPISVRFFMRSESVTGSKSRIAILQIAWLVSLPLLGMVGAQLVDTSNNNTIILALYPSIALTVLVIAIRGERIHPYVKLIALFSISLAWLYSESLSSGRIISADMLFEKYTANMVLEAQHWDQTGFPHIYNSMLSVTVLPAMTSVVLGITVDSLFMWLYPALLSLVPPILFLCFRHQFGDTFSFLAVFFFVSLSIYVGAIQGAARMIIAYVLFAAFILAIFRKSLTPQIILVELLLLFGIVTAHYMTALFFIATLVLMFLIYELFNHIRRHNPLVRLKVLEPTSLVSGAFVVLAVTIFVSWAIYISNSVVAENIVGRIYEVYRTLTGESLTEEYKALNLLQLLGIESMPSVMYEVWRGFIWFTQLLVVIGLFYAVIRHLRRPSAWPSNFLIFSGIGALVLLGLGMVMPSLSFSPTRIYHAALFYLAPFCILGWIVLVKFVRSLLKRSEFSTGSEHRCLTLMTIVILVPYFLLNTGFIFEITKDIPSSVALSRHRIESLHPEDSWGEKYAGALIYAQDAAASEWAGDYFGPKSLVYADHLELFKRSSLVGYGGIAPGPDSIQELKPTSEFTDFSYVFLRRFNVEQGYFTQEHPEFRAYTITGYYLYEVAPMFKDMNLIYSNGSNLIYANKMR